MSTRFVERFREIPNVGPATTADFRKLGFQCPADLIGQDPYRMYEDLCRITNTRQDPCVMDVFIAAVRYMDGGPKRNWWDFTAERKRHLKSGQV